MSNNDMVMVPVDLMESAIDAFGSIGMHDELDQLNEILNAPTDQNHGEPVALPMRMDEMAADWKEDPKAHGWNACLDEIAKLGPMYSRPTQGEPVALVDEGDEGLFVDLIYGANGNPLRRGDRLYARQAPADPGEVERLRTELGEAKGEHDRAANKVEELRGIIRGLEQNVLTHSQFSASMRAKLAEAHTLLRDIKTGIMHRGWVVGCSMHAQIDAALSASAEPATPALVECDACPRSSGCVGTCMKAPASAEPSAAVEIDERAAFEEFFTQRAKILPLLRGATTTRYAGGQYVNDWALFGYIAWQARAALERNP